MTTAKEEVLAGMNEAAEDARKEFNQIEKKHPDAVIQLEDWWRKHYMNAGHKRLAYILMHKPMK